MHYFLALARRRIQFDRRFVAGIGLDEDHAGARCAGDVADRFDQRRCDSAPAMARPDSQVIGVNLASRLLKLPELVGNEPSMTVSCRRAVKAMNVRSASSDTT